VGDRVFIVVASSPSRFVDLTSGDVGTRIVVLEPMGASADHMVDELVERLRARGVRGVKRSYMCG